MMENKYTEQQMEQFRNRDHGLRKAVKHGMENDVAKCPTNLSYLTIQRIKVEHDVAIKRSKMWDVVLVGFVIIAGLIAIAVFCGPALANMVKNMRQDILSEAGKSFNLLLFLMTGICFCFFFGLNEFLRRHFEK
jgi:hypothetical protein